MGFFYPSATNSPTCWEMANKNLAVRHKVLNIVQAYSIIQHRAARIASMYVFVVCVFVLFKSVQSVLTFCFVSSEHHLVLVNESRQESRCR